MKIYFDESGQTGCVLQKKDMLNFAILMSLLSFMTTIVNSNLLKKKYRRNLRPLFLN